MYAHLHSTRLAPKKANLMAKMVRGMSVPDAMELLRNTSKKSARLFEQLLRSAIANAEHNFKQDAQRMVLKTVVVNQGTALRRGIPMARGRVRPIRKFMCHITLTLGIEGEKPERTRFKHEAPVAAKVVKADESAKKPSQTAKKSVKSSGSSAKKKTDAKSSTTAPTDSSSSSAS